MIDYLINIKESDIKDKEIFRIFSFERFVDLLSEKRLALVLPEKWDDPFENFVINSRISLLGVKQAIFGQCWTYNSETDFMWRVYAPDKNGIKIKSRIDKLYDNLTKNEKCIESNQIPFVGSVIYENWDKIKEKFEQLSLHNDILTNDLKTLIETLYIKRKEFVAEKEFRIIVFDDNKQNSDNYDNVIFIDIEPTEIIEEIIIDPRVDNEKFQVWKNLFNKLGFTGKIEKSELYSFKGLEIND